MVPMRIPVECFTLHPRMKLSVIIVNYNVKYFLEQCLHSVVRATSAIDAEVIVVDNNSGDRSIEYLSPRFAHVQFITNTENLGFGKANNRALAVAKGEYVLFLNPDTIVPEDCLVSCLAFLDKKTRAGAIGIRMLDGSGRFLPESKRSFPTTVSAFYKLAGLSALFPTSKHFNRYSLGYLDERSDHAVDVLAGAFIMARKNVLDMVSGFDESFFMYGEDIDLSYRIRKAGYENWYVAQSRVIHFKGESTKKESTKYLKMFYNAMIVFVNKHYRGRGAWAMRAALKTGIALRGVSRWLFQSTGAGKPKQLSACYVVVGSREEYLECQNIVNTTSKAPQLIEHFPSTALESIAPGTIIIFCNGTVTYNDALSLMEQNGPRYRYRFHAKGSNSIVGSDSKEFTGETMAV